MTSVAGPFGKALIFLAIGVAAALAVALVLVGGGAYFIRRYRT